MQHSFCLLPRPRVLTTHAFNEAVMAASSTSGPLLIRRYYAQLVEAIVDPTRLANVLYSKGLITESSRMDAGLSNPNPLQRASKLLSDVERVIKASPKKFEVFLSILKEELTTETLIQKIEQEYDSETTSTPPIITDEAKSTVRPRKHDRKSNTTTPATAAAAGIEETDNGAMDEFSYWPAVKGIGAVLVVSIVIWIICMFVYSMPVVKDQLDKTAEEAFHSNIPTGKTCHKLNNPTTAFEELHTDISDSYTLGIYLQIPKVKMDIIEKENRSEREKLINVLHTCYEQDLCPCWEDIVNAVLKYGNTRRAKEIESKYVITSNEN